MGHYASEMLSDDRNEKQIKKDKLKQDRSKAIEKKLCKVFGVSAKELKEVYKILKRHNDYNY